MGTGKYEGNFTEFIGMITAINNCIIETDKVQVSVQRVYCCSCNSIGGSSTSFYPSCEPPGSIRTHEQSCLLCGRQGIFIDLGYGENYDFTGIYSQYGEEFPQILIGGINNSLKEMQNIVPYQEFLPKLKRIWGKIRKTEKIRQAQDLMQLTKKIIDAREKVTNLEAKLEY
jgi:hypothetical protein